MIQAYLPGNILVKKSVKAKKNLEIIKAKANECSKLISDTKAKYLANLGSKLNDPYIGPKKYLSILNTVLNKKKIPLITDMTAKANIFDDYFASQCSPTVNSSTLPQFAYKTITRLHTFETNDNKINDIIQSLNCSKSHGLDDISVKNG